jgi:mannitol/fructose-specific phosphotransferase system IIA component (Ntr-type)
MAFCPHVATNGKARMIGIGEILDPSCVFMDLPGDGKARVLRAMTDRLAELGRIHDSGAIHALLMEREGLMTTGVRRGFAFPHAFNARIEHSFLSLGVAPGGTDFESLDNEPVHFVFLLLGPPDNQSIHLRILARVSRLTGQPEMLQIMRQARTREELLEVIHDSEQQLKTSSSVFPDLRE